MSAKDHETTDLNALAQEIKTWGRELGFQQVGITDLNVTPVKERMQAWLAKDYHGKMGFLARHFKQRFTPTLLSEDARTAIVVRIDYLPPNIDLAHDLQKPKHGFISCYARGRDYHKLVRRHLAKLAKMINHAYGDFKHRAFTDSAPVLEKPLAEKAGLGWMGKHTNLINRKAGSWFFLGVLYTNLDLPIDVPDAKNHCGRCQACIDVCPTKAIVAPYQLDARRCISYLTIELREAIPIEFRKAMGNRIYGCDDCQLVCPWNRFAKTSQETAFHTRTELDTPTLITLFQWDEAIFLKNTEGSAIRRIGHECWQRNIAVALGNAPYDSDVIALLEANLKHDSALVREHIVWAYQQQCEKA